MRPWLYMILALALFATPAAAPAQESRPLAISAGAAGGVASGIIVTMGWIVKRATIDQQYLHEPGDIVGLIGTPLIAFPAAGVALAVIEPDLLWSVGAGAGLGTLAGAAGGVALGHVLAGGRTGRWAGGIMGAGAGLMAGIAVGSIRGLGNLTDSESPGDASAARVPLLFTVSF